MSLKKITLSGDERILSVVRRYAAERNASVNSLVRDYLTGIAKRQEKAGDARKRIEELSETSDARLGSAVWNRDSIHDG